MRRYEPVPVHRSTDHVPFQATALLTLAGIYSAITAVSAHGPRGGRLAIAALELVAAAVVLALPWRRWQPSATLWITIPSFAFIALSTLAEIVPIRSYGLIYGLIFAIVGANHPPRTCLRLVPPAVVAYGAPLLVAHTDPPLDPRALILNLIVCILLAETVARANQSSRAAQARADRAAGQIDLVGRTLAAVRGLDPEAVLDNVVDATIAMGYEVAYLAVVDTSGATFTLTRVRGMDVPAGPYPVDSGVAGQVLATGTPVVVDYRDVDFGHAEGYKLRLRSTVGVPVSVGGSPRAVLLVAHLDATHVEPEDVQSLKVLAETAGHALTLIGDQNEFRRTVERRERHHDAVIATQQALHANALDVDGIFQVVADRASEITGALLGAVEIAEGDEMVYRAASGSATGAVGTRLALHSSLSGRCVLTGEVLRCDDAHTDDRVDREACDRLGVRSMVVVPLRGDGKTLGVLKVASDRVAAFDDDDVATLLELADFIGDSLRIAADFGERDRLALVDDLTGLPNRRAFVATLDAALQAGDRRGIAVLFVDLDGFKAVNDTFGHDVGDLLLAAIGHELSTAMRANDFVGRIGGDEFVVLCPRTNPSTIEHVIERLEASVARAAAALEHPVVVGASVGVAWADQHQPTSDAVLGAADAEMYAAKQARRRARASA
jgi:diguanylate cyclase (GGDEF)-like protein